MKIKYKTEVLETKEKYPKALTKYFKLVTNLFQLNFNVENKSFFCYLWHSFVIINKFIGLNSMR